jgi:hypothetical protein
MSIGDKKFIDIGIILIVVGVLILLAGYELSSYNMTVYMNRIYSNGSAGPTTAFNVTYNYINGPTLPTPSPGEYLVQLYTTNKVLTSDAGYNWGIDDWTNNGSSTTVYDALAVLQNTNSKATTLPIPSELPVQPSVLMSRSRP